jgi:hypothetical protein
MTYQHINGQIGIGQMQTTKQNLKLFVLKLFQYFQLKLLQHFTLKLFQYFELEEVLKKREGAISFAGEHTGTPHAWINTAIKTGIRAALEIQKSQCYD